MRLGNIKYKKCIKLVSHATVGEARSLLEAKGVNYCLVEKEGGRHAGYISSNYLTHLIAEKSSVEQNLLEDYVHQIDRIYSPEDYLGDIPKASKLPFFILEEETNSYSVIDLEQLLLSFQDCYDQKEQLNKELDVILDFSLDEIYIIDGKGFTLLANKAFEENSGIPVEKVLNRNVIDLEKEGYFKPSIGRMVLEEKRQVTTLQKYYDNEKRHLVTGTPVFDNDGSISRVIINTRDTAKLRLLELQLEEIERLKESYYQELLDSNPVKLNHIEARCSRMTQLLETTRKVAEVDTTILLLGESGIGKSLLARYIHDNSRRSDQPFITISCGAIPENLLESELFGYEAGAFTGANAKGKIGKIELADKGTLFLDEIGDFPLPLQVKLLHVIQEGVITRLGGNKEIKPDVRFIAATNKNLSEMVSKGNFREDLYYRLNVIPLEIPPLRQRVDDIEPLLLIFLKEFNRKYDKNVTISPNALAFLKNYRWPGNVRELENLIERLVIVGNGETIETEHLPESIKMENMAQDVVNNDLIAEIAPLTKIKEDVEKKLLERLYRQYKNTYKIAEFLKVNQSTVARKLKKYKISR